MSNTEQARLTKARIALYRNGGEGFIQWVEDNVWMPIYPEGGTTSEWCPMSNLPDIPNPETGRSYRYMWEKQKPYFLEALKMNKGRLKHRLIVFCWPRGEGKSAIACLVQVWKFFCFPKQSIVLGANSKDQTKFVHYEIIKDIILNSPNLLMHIGGAANIMDKSIVIRNQHGHVVSSITAISSFSGIRSNITGYTFSEMFDMKNPKFFSQIDGSTRNVPNAIGVIDSTVSDKGHILYKLYETYKSGKAPYLYFSHRSSQDARQEDYFHPQMGQTQLDDYRAKFLKPDFDRYFKNTWEAGATRMYSPEVVAAINYLGLDKHVGNQQEVVRLLGLVEQHRSAIMTLKDEADTGFTEKALQVVQSHNNQTAEAMSRLFPVSDLYGFLNGTLSACIMDVPGIQKLTDKYDTNFMLGVGLDRADPMAVEPLARTVVTAVLKGLPGSRSNPYIAAGSAPPYIYFIAGVIILADHDLEDIKKSVALFHEELDGVDTFCGEKWGAWDMRSWCEVESIATELISPTYEKQRAAFNEMFVTINAGRLKSPPLPVLGTTLKDILAEELSLFTHDPVKKWFGSPEKHTRGGIQDDMIYSLGWCVYGMREYEASTFRTRHAAGFHTLYIDPETTYGNYR